MRYRLISTRLLAALLVTALAAACSDDPKRAAGAVEGTWALAEDSAGAVFLRVQGEEVDVFTENTIGDCFVRADYRIIEARGIDFRITNGPDTLTIEMRRDEDVLRVTAFDREAAYMQSSVNPESLSLCQPPEPDADCGTLPTLIVGSEVVDSLDETDPTTDLGTRYELYALDFDSPLDLVVAMSSTEVDSYLSLHDSTGAFIEANDDRSSRTLDAQLELSLAAGCHILMATTAGPNELGEFELDVVLPDPTSPRRTK